MDLQQDAAGGGGLIERLAWALLALVHFAPALALFSPALLTKLYDVQIGHPLFLLMHHRAALFLAVFAACIWCAIDRAPRRMSIIVVAISMLSFLVLYFANGSPSALKQIAIADLIGLPALAFVGWKAFS